MRIRRTGAALIAASLSTIGLVGVAALPAQAASCPDNNWSINDGRIGQFFASNGVNIRTGPSTGCTSVGQGQKSHSVQVDCYKSGEGGTWTHLFDFTTNKEGWSKDSLLVGTGALEAC
jgi:hypothetical protein